MKYRTPGFLPAHKMSCPCCAYRDFLAADTIKAKATRAARKLRARVRNFWTYDVEYVKWKLGFIPRERLQRIVIDIV